MQPQGQWLGCHTPPSRAACGGFWRPDLWGPKGRPGVRCGIVCGWGPCMSPRTADKGPRLLDMKLDMKVHTGTTGLDHLGQTVQEEGWAPREACSQRCRAVTRNGSPGSQASSPHPAAALGSPNSPSVSGTPKPDPTPWPSGPTSPRTPHPFPEPSRPPQPAVPWGLSLPAFG